MIRHDSALTLISDWQDATQTFRILDFVVFGFWWKQQNLVQQNRDWGVVVWAKNSPKRQTLISKDRLKKREKKKRERKKRERLFLDFVCFGSKRKEKRGLETRFLKISKKNNILDVEEGIAFAQNCRKVGNSLKWIYQLVKRRVKSTFISLKTLGEKSLGWIFSILGWTTLFKK